MPATVKSQNATATKTKQYHMMDVNVKKIDEKINRLTFNAICSLNHLTPASEAKMENLLVPGSVVVPTQAEIIKRNSPDFEPVLTTPVEDWDTVADNEKPPAEAYEYD